MTESVICYKNGQWRADPGSLVYVPKLTWVDFPSSGQWRERPLKMNGLVATKISTEGRVSNYSYP